MGFSGEHNGASAGTLAGKIAIVTGGGRDIGRVCALRLAAAGAAVEINYHSSAAGADSAVANLVSDEAAVITGANVDINGWVGVFLTSLWSFFPEY